MRNNALVIACRHALKGSSRIGTSAVGSVVRTKATSPTSNARNLSSVVAVRSDTESCDASPTGHRQIRGTVNGTIKLPSKSQPSKSQTPKPQQSKAEVASTGSEKEQIEITDVRDNYTHQEHTDDEPHVSPTHLMYTGGTSMPLTSRLKIVEPGHNVPSGGIWPVFRIMVSAMVSSCKSWIIDCSKM